MAKMKIVAKAWFMEQNKSEKHLNIDAYQYVL
jgi:hypothetical protein